MRVFQFGILFQHLLVLPQGTLSSFSRAVNQDSDNDAYVLPPRPPPSSGKSSMTLCMIVRVWRSEAFQHCGTGDGGVSSASKLVLMVSPGL